MDFINNKYSEEELRKFVKRNLSKNDWSDISACQTLSENFIREFKDKINWFDISQYQNLSEDFIRKFQDKVNWYRISAYQDLSGGFIREFQDKVYWSYISIYQNLSKNFIEEFKDKVDWDYISQYQNLSEDFIREFQDKISWYALRYNKKIRVSDEFTIEFDKKLGYNNCWMINNQFHRILSSAIVCIYDDGKKEYWYRGKQVEVFSDKEYFEWLKYKDF